MMLLIFLYYCTPFDNHPFRPLTFKPKCICWRLMHTHTTWIWMYNHKTKNIIIHQRTSQWKDIHSLNRSVQFYFHCHCCDVYMTLLSWTSITLCMIAQSCFRQFVTCWLKESKIQLSLFWFMINLFCDMWHTLIIVNVLLTTSCF